MSTEIVLAIVVTSLATYSSRFLGMLTSLKINEKSKIYRWFICLAYSTLAALISRVLIFPNGVLMDTSYLIRVIVILIAILIYFVTKKNLVYPTVFSAIILAIISGYSAWESIFNKSVWKIEVLVKKIQLLIYEKKPIKLSYYSCNNATYLK